MRRSALAVAATLAGGLLLAGCGEEEGIPEGGTDRGLEEEVTPSPTEPPAIDAGSELQPFDCFDVSPTGPGVYEAGDAGRVEISADDGAFSVVSVEPAEGWAHEVEEEDGLRVEVRFRPVGGDDGEADPRDDDDFADASDPHEHLADSDDQEILILVVAQGPSADAAEPQAELCTSLS